MADGKEDIDAKEFVNNLAQILLPQLEVKIVDPYSDCEFQAEDD